MYESFCKLKGKKVCNKDGKYFGRLSDILVKKGTSDIIGIVSQSDSLIFRHRLFLKKDILGSDEVAVFVNGRGERFVKNTKDGDHKSCENDIYKRKAVFGDGSEAGMIQNISFDLETGTIIGFEIGSSLAHDLLYGRKICRTQNTINICRGNVVVDNDLEEDPTRKKIFFL